jgi:hypothetical protein
MERVRKVAPAAVPNYLRQSKGRAMGIGLTLVF